MEAPFVDSMMISRPRKRRSFSLAVGEIELSSASLDDEIGHISPEERWNTLLDGNETKRSASFTLGSPGSPNSYSNREKALKVLGVSENDVEMSMRFFLPRRMLYGAHFPGTRNTIIRQALRHVFPNQLDLMISLVIEYNYVSAQKQINIPGKALRLLGAKNFPAGRRKALRILGETNHQIEETNARDLARLGIVTPCYEADEDLFCCSLSSQVLWSPFDIKRTWGRSSI
ncbi:hypothetical protein AAMO2058_000329800 [Amorphochlora amoebiformis]